jgi:vitamin B12 transporter
MLTFVALEGGRMGTHFRLLVAMFLGVALVLADMAGAEEVAEPAYDLSEMVVTATKTQRKVEEVSTNVTVVTREEIERVQATSLADLLRYVPGLVINGLGSDASLNYVAFRGIQPSSRGILILRDGIEMNGPTNVVDLLRTPLADIERIEVVKTPSSALYGVAGVGGVIQIFTRKPEKPVKGAASVTYGSFNRIETQDYVAGRLANGLTYGLSTWYFDTEGFRDQSDLRNFAISPGLGWANERVYVEVLSNIKKIWDDQVPGPLPLSTCKDDPTK